MGTATFVASHHPHAPHPRPARGSAGGHVPMLRAGPPLVASPSRRWRPKLTGAADAPVVSTRMRVTPLCTTTLCTVHLVMRTAQPPYGYFFCGDAWCSTSSSTGGGCGEGKGAAGWVQHPQWSHYMQEALFMLAGTGWSCAEGSLRTLRRSSAARSPPGRVPAPLQLKSVPKQTTFITDTPYTQLARSRSPSISRRSPSGQQEPSIRDSSSRPASSGAGADRGAPRWPPCCSQRGCTRTRQRRASSSTHHGARERRRRGRSGRTLRRTPLRSRRALS